MTLPPPDADIVPRTPTSGDYVFISYARKNSEFAKEICDWLDTQKINAWIDAVNITEKENWWEAICEGIRGSIAFIFILTPEIMNSAVSQLELDYALSQGKQVIFLHCIDPERSETDVPFVTDATDTTTLEERAAESLVVVRLLTERKKTIKEIAIANSEKIAYFNWNNWDITKPDCGQMEKLLGAIQTNLEHKQLHRRLALLAADWSTKNRSSSYYLRGSELIRAEAWERLAQDPKQRPEITDLQRDFIRASRHATNRLNTVIAVVAVIVAIVVSIFAFRESIARADAQARAEEAIVERNHAQNILQTFAMVDNTLKQPVGNSPRPPLRLGTDLWVTNYDDDTVMQLAADTGVPRRAPIPVGKAPLDPVTDNRYVWVVNSGENTIARIDPQTSAAPLLIEVGNEPRSLFVTKAWIWVSTGSPRDKILVQIERDSGTVVQSVKIGQLTGEITFDGTYLWAGIGDPRQPALVRINHETGERLIIDLDAVPRTPIAAFNHLWLTQLRSTLLQQIDPTAGVIVQTYDLGAELAPPLADGKWLWIPTNNDIIQFSPETGKVVHEIAVTTSRPLFREGERLWVFANEGLLAFNVNTGHQLFRIELPGDYTNPVVVGDDLWLANTFEDVILMIRTTTGEILRSLPNCDAPTQPLFDGTNLWLACRDENAIARIPILISYYGANALSSNPDPYTPVYTEISGRPYLWIVQQGTGQMVQFDALDGRVLATIPVGDSPLPPIYDGERYIWVAAATGGLVTRVDTQDVRIYASMHVDIAEIAYIELLRGRLWVSGGSSNLFDLGGPDLVIIDPTRMTIVRQHELGVGASRAVYDDRYDVVWVSGAAMSGGTAYRMNADTGAILTEEPIGFVSYEPVFHDDDAWISSLYPMSGQNLISAVLQSNTGALYRLNRQTGRVIQTIDLDELPSLPLIAGNYIWITQGSFELETSGAAALLDANTTGANPRGVVAIDPESGEQVARWSPCRNVGIPYYDEGGFIWVICIGYEDSEHDQSGNIFVIDPETLQRVTEYTGLGRFSWPAQAIDEHIWIVFQESSNVAVFDSATAALLRVFGVGAGASKLTYDGSHYVWLSNGDDGDVQRIAVDFSP